MESHTQHIYNPYHSHNHALEHHNMYFISWSQRMILTNWLQGIVDLSRVTGTTITSPAHVVILTGMVFRLYVLSHGGLHLWAP